MLSTEWPLAPLAFAGTFAQFASVVTIPWPKVAAMPALTPSPLRPARFPDCPPVAGIEFAVGATGIRYRGRPDLLLVRMAEGGSAAGLFTRSRMPSAAVEQSRAALAASGGRARGLVVNAGNANAFTGRAGDAAARQIASAFARECGMAQEAVLLASTGVIGEPLDPDPIIAAIKAAAWGACDWHTAATAIGTTDTFPKAATATALLDGMAVTLVGIAKGSGMIAPDMATLLAFIFTDACLSPPVLDALLREANEPSFNSITVDGDCSTSDSLVMFASGAAGNAEIRDAADPRLDAFRQALGALMLDLAQQVVKDGEGAQKFITIRISGAESDAAARRIGFSIANSPLVKTAIAGADPNWGRIVMAVGKSGERADRDRLRIVIGGQLVAAEGARHPAYSEPEAAAHMKGREIEIAVDVGVGRGRATVYGCDLTSGYIAINADYRS